MNNSLKELNRFADQYPFLITLLWMLVFFLPMIGRGMWNPDDPRCLEAIWEMAFANAHMVPVFNNTLYLLFFPFILGMTIIVPTFSIIIAQRIGRISGMTNIDGVETIKWHVNDKIGNVFMLKMKYSVKAFQCKAVINVAI